jgi:hypothetical protein
MQMEVAVTAGVTAMPLAGSLVEFRCTTNHLAVPRLAELTSSIVRSDREDGVNSNRAPSKIQVQKSRSVFMIGSFDLN